MFDDDGNQVMEPEEARRLFAKPENVMVAIVDNGESSTIRLYLSDSTETNAVMGLITTLRGIATKYNMIFNVGRYDGIITPKDFSTKVSVKEQEDYRMNLVEGMYGTSRTSYLKLENARMIVRHSARVNERLLGARGRNIDAIFIENALGERSLFPTKQLAPARAMTHHVDNGGHWSDAIGNQIGRMAQSYSDLGVAARHINGSREMLPEGAGDLYEQCQTARGNMRKVFERMCRKTGYLQESKRLAEQAKAQTKIRVPVDEGRIAELEEMINSGKRKLDRSVLETLARVLDNSLNEEAPVMKSTVTVFDKAVNKDAWDLLKANRIELSGKPQMPDNPDFQSKTAELTYKLNILIPLVMDDTLLNLLSYIAEELPVSTDKTQLERMRAISVAALRAAGMAMNEGFAVKAQAIREFDSWMKQFSLMETIKKTDCEGCAKEEDEDKGGDECDGDECFESVITESVRLFRLNDFLASPLAENFGYPAHPDATLSEKTYPKGYVVKALEAYARKKTGGNTPTCRRIAENVFPMVERRLIREGFTITDESELGEDMQLSREDVLIPTNKGADLKKEVTKSTVKKPDGTQALVDDSYVDSLRAGPSSSGRPYTA